MSTHFFDIRQYASIRSFIHDTCRLLGGNMDQEECRGEAWLAYWDAKITYHRYEGCCEWNSYLYYRVQEAIDEYRRVHNRNISLESPLSLDQPLGDSNETPGTLFFHHQGDFTRGVDLWDYAWRLGECKYAILRQTANKESDVEIMSNMSMQPEEYYSLKYQLRADFERFLRI